MFLTETRVVADDGIPSAMCPKVESQTGNTSLYNTVLIANKANIHRVKHLRQHIFTAQPELVPLVICCIPCNGQLTWMVALTQPEIPNLQLCIPRYIQNASHCVVLIMMLTHV